MAAETLSSDGQTKPQLPEEGLIVNWDKFIDDTTPVRAEGNMVIGDDSPDWTPLLPGVLAVAAEFLAEEQEALGNEEAVSRLNAMAAEMRNREAERIALTLRNHWWQLWRPRTRAKPSNSEVIRVAL